MSENTAPLGSPAWTTASVMAENAAPIGPPRTWPDGFGRWLHALSRWSAIAGGLLLVALVGVSLVSIVGRKLASMPIPGDIELLQLGAAVATSTFFAYCHMVRDDIRVDFFTHSSPIRTTGLMDAIGSSCVCAMAAALAWRSAAGVRGLREGGDATAILDLPIWLAQAAMIPGLLLLAVCAGYMATVYWRERAGSAQGGRA